MLAILAFDSVGERRSTRKLERNTEGVKIQEEGKESSSILTNRQRERRKKEAFHDREGTLALGNGLFALSERPGSRSESDNNFSASMVTFSTHLHLRPLIKISSCLFTIPIRNF